MSYVQQMTIGKQTEKIVEHIMNKRLKVVSIVLLIGKPIFVLLREVSRMALC